MAPRRVDTASRKPCTMPCATGVPSSLASDVASSLSSFSPSAPDLNAAYSRPALSAAVASPAPSPRPRPISPGPIAEIAVRISAASAVPMAAPAEMMLGPAAAEVESVTKLGGGVGPEPVEQLGEPASAFAFHALAGPLHDPSAGAVG